MSNMKHKELSNSIAKWPENRERIVPPPRRYMEAQGNEILGNRSYQIKRQTAFFMKSGMVAYAC